MGEAQALTKMRESLQKKLGSSSEMYSDATLTRFLIARSMNAEKAAKMLVEWRKWRASMVPNGGLVSECEIAEELEARKLFLQGLSQDKYPVLIVQASKHFPSKDHIQFKKYVVYLLDKTIASAIKGREIGNEKLIGILDLQHISYRNIDVRGFITGFQFLQAYYPERLAKLYVINMPQFFVSVWKLICRFLEKATLEKIVIIGNDEDERKQFVKDIGEEVLPQEYGGQAQLVALQDVALTITPFEENATTN